MKKYIILKISLFFFLTLFIYGESFFLTHAKTRGVKTYYKRYSIFDYKKQQILCEPYIVKKGDWLFKIFKNKGEISEKDFPLFINIFKQLNPKINNIDKIKSGQNILIPLQKIKLKEYNQTSPGNIDLPVIEFSTIHENLELKSFIHKHRVQKGETFSSLIDDKFLNKNGGLSKEGLKVVQLANPHIKNINIIYEGTDIYLPDPSITSQPWFDSFLSGKARKKQTQTKEQKAQQYKIEDYELAQLKKYTALIGGTLLNRGKMHFPTKHGSDQILDLSSTPVIETSDGSRILILSGDNVNDKLLEHARTYWKDLKTQLISETISKIKNHEQHKNVKRKNIIYEHKNFIATLLSQTDHEYLADAKISFNINTIELKALFGRIMRKEKKDILINFATVHGAALKVLEKRKFKILTITSRLTTLEVTEKLFSHLGYKTWKNPSFLDKGNIETLAGIYAAKKPDKLFIPVKPLSISAIQYLEKEDIKILSTKDKNQTQ